MAVGHRAGFGGHHARRDAGDVGPERERDQIEHQRQPFGERLLRQRRPVFAASAPRLVHATLDVADAVEVVAERWRGPGAQSARRCAASSRPDRGCSRRPARLGHRASGAHDARTTGRTVARTDVHRAWFSRSKRDRRGVAFVVASFPRAGPDRPVAAPWQPQSIGSNVSPTEVIRRNLIRGRPVARGAPLGPAACLRLRLASGSVGLRRSAARSTSVGAAPRRRHPGSSPDSHVPGVIACTGPYAWWFSTPLTIVTRSRERCQRLEDLAEPPRTVRRPASTCPSPRRAGSTRTPCVEPVEWRQYAAPGIMASSSGSATVGPHAPEEGPPVQMLVEDEHGAATASAARAGRWSRLGTAPSVE